MLMTIIGVILAGSSIVLLRWLIKRHWQIDLPQILSALQALSKQPPPAETKDHHKNATDRT